MNEEERRQARWIFRHITARECSTFIPVLDTQTGDGQSQVSCQCGYTYEQHSQNAKKNQLRGEKWDYRKHSMQKPTNAYGDIEFVGYGGNVGKYIRVDADTNMSDIVHIMMKFWGLDEPNLLISVTGGAKNLQMDKRLKDSFRRGLIKAAITTGAWIDTGGTYAGVMRYVGEAVKDFGTASTHQKQAIAIGVAPWGCIQNREILINEQGLGLWPAYYRIGKEQNTEETFLDPNHTHFILVDNGTQHRFGSEIPFRARLQKEIAKRRTNAAENAVAVPLVLLVLEGGSGALEMVEQAIHNNTPCVIVKGSGKASDILAYAYQNAAEKEIETVGRDGEKMKSTQRFMEKSLLLKVEHMVKEEFERNEDLHMDRIKHCLEKCDFMSLIEINDKYGVEGIDGAILQALLKANKYHVMDQLWLALTWNRIYVAKSKIFTEDRRWPEMNEEERQQAKWVSRHITGRECSAFIPAPDSQARYSQSQGNCQCGYTYEQHSQNAQKNKLEGEKWDYKKHSIQKPTNAYGNIEFVGYGGKVGKYIRVDADTNMSDMMHIMMKFWGLDEPNLLISVTGGAKNLQMDKRLKESFRRGLIKAAITTGAWIDTGGTYAGVMRYVGEAVKDFGTASTHQKQAIAIGVAPWGCIQNREILINEQGTGLWPANYRIGKKQNTEETFLDPNHTHFILVDNATQHNFGSEIPFRARLQNEVAKRRTDTGENAVAVPLVLLVLEGGSGALEMVEQAIHNNTPCVIVKGSGKASDILAYAYQNAEEKEIETVDQDGKKMKSTQRFMEKSLLLKVQDMVKEEFVTNEDIHMHRIKNCLKKCDFMSLIEINDKYGVEGIDGAILQALLKANKYRVMDQLRLALIWNRIDVANSKIFTEDRRWPTGSLDDVMLSALQLNRPDFVELFLNHGVSLREFLTKERLKMLYSNIPTNCLLRSLLDRVRSREDQDRKDCLLSDVDVLIQHLIGHSIRQEKNSKTKHLNESALSLSRIDEVDTKHKQPDFENASKELFIWSVLMLRRRMTKLFWAEGKDAMAAALVANSILRSMKEKSEDTELVLRIQWLMDDWSELSLGVLKKCHLTDERKAQNLLVRQLTNWGGITCMEIAIEANNKDFISQTACQSLLNQIWMGKLAQNNSAWQMILSAVCPPLILVLLEFRTTYDKSDRTSKRKVSATNYSKQDEAEKSILLRSQRKSRKDSSYSSECTDTRIHESQSWVQTVTHTFRNRIYSFFKAPVIICLNNLLSYLVFLTLFAYVLIVEFSQEISTAEIVLIVWVITAFFEEIRQLAAKSGSLTAKCHSYLTDTWNVFDVITIVLFVIPMVLRFLPRSKTIDTFETARVFMAVSFVSFFLRLLPLFAVHKKLGPKLIMIGRMVQDLMYFLVILLVFVISYAIASHSIMYPNSPLKWSTAVEVIRKSYWIIYGELFLEDFEENPYCTHEKYLWENGTQPRCPTDTGKVVVPILMSMYVLLANVLLLNLLIAMFSYTFTLVQDNTDKHWSFQRYFLIKEYYTRPALCQPLVFFSHMYLLVKFICSCCCRKCASDPQGNVADDDDDFHRKFKNESELVEWENLMADAYRQETELKQSESIESQVNDTNICIKHLSTRIDDIQEQQEQHRKLIANRGITSLLYIGSYYEKH